MKSAVATSAELISLIFLKASDNTGGRYATLCASVATIVIDDCCKRFCASIYAAEPKLPRNDAPVT